MQIGELLDAVRGAKRSQVYFLIKRGYLRPVEKREAGKISYDFSERDAKKLQLMLDLRQQGKRLDAASRMADQQLSTAANSQQPGEKAKLILIGPDEHPIRNGLYRLEGLGMELETNHDGEVDVIRFGSDLLLRAPHLREAGNDVAELIAFLVAMKRDGIVTEKQVDAISMLIDLYAGTVDKARSLREGIFAASLQSLERQIRELADGSASVELIAEDLVKAFEQFPTVQLDGMKLGDSMVTASNLCSDPALAALFFGGLYGVRKKGVTLGYLNAPKPSVDVRPNITVPLAHLANLIAGPFFFRLFADRIIQQYGLDMSVDLVSPERGLPEADAREGLRLLKRAVVQLRRSFNELFTMLPHSLTLYSQGATIYTAGAARVHVYSQTSGLVIAEERFGDQELLKNPYRQLYFAHGLLGPDAARIPRFYQWDQDATALSLHRNHERHDQRGQGELYRKRCSKLLAQSLVEPNLELSEADFDVEPWKRFLTIVSEESVLVSARSEKMRQHIIHGLLLNRRAASQPSLVKALVRLVGLEPNESIACLHLFDAVHSAYMNRPKRVIKALMHVAGDPEKDAEAVVDALLSRGAQLAAKEKP